MMMSTQSPGTHRAHPNSTQSDGSHGKQLRSTRLVIGEGSSFKVPLHTREWPLTAPPDVAHSGVLLRARVVAVQSLPFFFSSPLPPLSSLLLSLARLANNSLCAVGVKFHLRTTHTSSCIDPMLVAVPPRLLYTYQRMEDRAVLSSSFLVHSLCRLPLPPGYRWQMKSPVLCSPRAIMHEFLMQVRTEVPTNTEASWRSYAPLTGRL